MTKTELRAAQFAAERDFDISVEPLRQAYVASGYSAEAGDIYLTARIAWADRHPNRGKPYFLPAEVRS